MIALTINRPSLLDQIWQDLQPTPGRLHSSLRIVLSTVIALLLLMTLRMSFASIGLYFIFLIGRDSPSVSFRSSLVSFVVVAFAVMVELAVVILSDNDPVARLLSVAIITFIAGVLVAGTSLPALGSSFGLIYCTVIALWEETRPRRPPGQRLPQAPRHLCSFRRLRCCSRVHLRRSQPGRDVARAAPHPIPSPRQHVHPYTLKVQHRPGSSTPQPRSLVSP